VRGLAIVLAIALGVPTIADGQPNPQQQQINRRERIKKRIRALRAYTLTEELSLDPPTAEKLFPVLNKYDDVFDKLLVARAELGKRLAAASNGRDPQEANKAIEDAIANQRAFWDMEDKRLAELRKILSPQQIARLLVVLPPLERKIENQLRNAIAGKGPGANRPPPDDADDIEDLAPPRRNRP
jgi:hypothetical protein